MPPFEESIILNEVKAMPNGARRRPRWPSGIDLDRFTLDLDSAESQRRVKGQKVLVALRPPREAKL